MNEEAKVYTNFHNKTKESTPLSIPLKLLLIIINNNMLEEKNNTVSNNFKTTIKYIFYNAYFECTTTICKLICWPNIWCRLEHMKINPSNITQ